MAPPNDAFRSNLRSLVERSGRSMRAFSAALGRDEGYVASLLDPRRPARARPTPADLVRASDALGIPFVELLELLWGIPRERLAAELIGRDAGGGGPAIGAGLSDDDRASLNDYAAYLEARSARPDEASHPNDRS